MSTPVKASEASFLLAIEGVSTAEVNPSGVLFRTDVSRFVSHVY